MPAKIIFVLSEARTGSTLLCQLLANYKNVINFHEIFHVVGDGSSNNVFNATVSFNKVLQDYYNDGIFDRQKIFSEIAKNPKQLLTLMSDYFKETLIVKIHLSHLFSPSYSTSLILDWILMQPNNEFILLKRDFLKSYVSLLKAEQSNAWNNVDTTNIKIAIDPVKFKQESAKYKWKYDTIEQKLQEYKIDYLNIDYDKDLKNYNIAEFEQLIKSWSTRRGIDLISTGSNVQIGVKKQNTNDDISNSISNWQEISTMFGIEIS